MKTDYHQRLLPVIRHLEEQFNQPLNLEAVASLACLSPYHFHRIFKAVVGETLNEYLRRLRLEAAANDLFYKKPPITEVALEYGFSSSQSLAKAFKQHFDLTPSQIRQCESLDVFAQLLKNSKIGHVLRKNGHESDASNFYTPLEPKQWSETMEIQTFDPCQLAYVRVTGPYGENYEPAVNKLYGWAGPQGLAGNTNIFIYHDNPEITPADKCRTDICLFIDGDTVPNNGIEAKPFPGGKYGVIRQTITDKSQYASAWDSLMSQVVEQGLDSDDRPCFELYHSYDQATGEADVSFCTALAD
ncbi:AraC family transcriptional regulator [Vibrio sp. SCSIO 43135]|uniref:AraC family transcriptional regulator n=1 Tax=Vibrio sp. SCSIO 43135 TaxID=2819096 RepID=UPI00207527EE|nr:AraC family transcriptional regulator [Vibrio sp. SCSIO 43135]USD43102.1 AraC family transcriptional regulator [Vibrio sp. SCSIO 43135]